MSMTSGWDQLIEEGYAVIPSAVDVGVCEDALRQVDALKKAHVDIVSKNADEFGHLYRVVNLHLALDGLKRAFVENQRGLEVCDRFFGEPTSLYTTLYYERGSEQDFHRDTPYFSTKPAGKYLGVWLALDDVDDENGPLRVTPGSHVLPPINVEKMAAEIFPDPTNIPSMSMEGWNAYQGEVQKQAREHGLMQKNVHVRRGDVIIWHPEMLHGGAPHTNKVRSRRSLVMHVTPAGVPVYHIDVFFNPSKKVPTRAGWEYEEFQKRKIAKFDQVDFGHEYAVSINKLR
ncbi:phytanoyl-CoA dioxygenase family protein [Rhodanobacter denitrificans]|uniref:Phytanoyl-CoA dioxygenase family protein n=1 Tax=Rhodanobacter denitrificans TaxID=666685 RepID=A0A368KHV9_9GAMM|nr:phytanoyl-CoA dioxygenase family protein [Rhodanobacter denitrificans]RCS31504.1 phytanoyl-CoA dioxygenase family protein [Rhodanobacter denitrificans]